jgi:flagellar hook-associated protein 3 FlgL
MMIGNLAQRIADNAERLYRLQQQISSGKRIQAPADDPTGAARAMEMRSSLAQIAQYADNVEVGSRKLKIVDGLLGDLGTALRSARDLALQGADGALSVDSRAGLASDVDDLIRQVLDIANSESDGHYVFAGFKTLTTPFATTGGTPPVTYSGDTGVQTVEVGRNASVAVNLTGDQVFNMGGAGNPALDDVFTTLTKLRDEILAGDTAAVSARITDLDAQLGRALVLRADVGGKVQQLDLCATRLQGMDLTISEALSKTEDLDLAEAAVQLQAEQNVYQATAYLAAQVSQLKLVDYLP